MILAIDVGNTNVVVGCMEGSEIVCISRMATNATKTDSEYAILLKQILSFEGVDYTAFEGAIISSVVPPLTSTLKSAIKKLTGLDTMVVSAGLRTGLNIRLDNPAQLGSDLVVGAVAALHKYKPPIIAVDMGTASTISVIDGNANFLGGIISPGVALSLNALVSGTSQLPKISIEPPKNCIGTNTIECMKSGIVFGTAAMLDGLIDRIEAELGMEANIVATGGLSGCIVPYCRHKIDYDENLLLEGLFIVYHKNAKSR